MYDTVGSTLLGALYLHAFVRFLRDPDRSQKLKRNELEPILAINTLNLNCTLFWRDLVAIIGNHAI